MTYKHPVDSNFIEKELAERTVKELMEAQSYNIGKMIDNMIELTPEPSEDGEEYIFFVRHCIGRGEFETEDMVLAKKSEILDESIDYVQGYSYVFDTHAQMMGYKVAETYLTKYYLYDLLADFLYESSCFGTDQHALAEEREKLEEANKEAKDETTEYVTREEAKEELFGDLGFEEEKRIPEEEEAYWTAFKDIGYRAYEYNKLASQLEVELIRKIIEEEDV